MSESAAVQALQMHVLADQLHVFEYAGDEKSPGRFYCFLISIGHCAHVTAKAISQTIARHFNDWSPDILHLSQKEFESIERTALFLRLKQTYIKVKSAIEGAAAVGASLGKSERLNLIPLALASKVLHYYSANVQANLLAALDEFLAKHSDDSESKTSATGVSSPSALGLGLETASSTSGSGSGSGSHSALPSESSKGSRGKESKGEARTIAALNLGASKAIEELTDDENDMVLGTLLDNFVQWKPRLEEYENVREYGLKPKELSATLKEQCQRFAEYRQEIWNWSRDVRSVAAKTVSNNIQVLLLLGGFVCHITTRHRLRSDEFDMSVFASSHIEHYMLDFLRYLKGTRGVMFSTIANYVNALVVLAKFWFADEPLAELSFRAETVEASFVLTGLRRLRDQTNAKARVETLQRPVHSQWLSWQECQVARHRAIAEYESTRSKETSTLAFQDKRYQQLKRLVCLILYTVAPPPRCGIVRLLQWRTTLVKKRQDPLRYVIDLKNNADAPAAQHKTSKFYRRAILPLPRMLTPYLDELRQYRIKDESKGNWVFVNTRGVAYETAAWTAFVKSCFTGFTRNQREPNGSLLRSIFVTWLNSVPFTKQGQEFLEEMKQSAATYQTHSLRIANQHYDKDAASEAKLRELIEFCEAFAERAMEYSEEKLEPEDDNVDSDDEQFHAKQPLPPRKRIRRKKTSGPVDMEVDTDEKKEGKEVESSETIEEPEIEPEPQQLFEPDGILGKKTARWQHYYLVHWLGYSDAESTWEPAAFYDEHWSDLVKSYLQTRQPERIVQKKLRISKSTSTEEEFEFYEVQWLGQKETTLEKASMIESEEVFRPVLEAWQKRQLDLESKRAKKIERETAASLSRPGKRSHAAEGDEKTWTRSGRVKVSEKHAGQLYRWPLGPGGVPRCYAFSVVDLISESESAASSHRLVRTSAR